ncbi:MAG: hypothetical protein OES57_09280 [Acidimicrobiia bacterium]|nr:hypothetical protein [Acidimicrobiia bacterium]
MTSALCRAQQTATVPVLGPPGAGVRTMIEAASDIDRLPTASAAHGDRPPFQLGRLDVGDELIVRLFALSPETAHRSMWPALSADAFGMVVVVDGRDIGAGFGSLDLVERSGSPYGVVVNRFDGRLDYTLTEIRAAMDLDDSVVLTDADGRERVQAQMALLAVLDGLFGWH